MKKRFSRVLALLLTLLILVGCNMVTPNTEQEFPEDTSSLTDLLCWTSEEFLEALKTYQPSQTIQLYPGTYQLSEAIFLKESVTIVGEKTDNEDEKVIIEWHIAKDEPNTPLFQVEAKGVVFANLIINNIVDKTLGASSRNNEKKIDDRITLNIISGSAKLVNCSIDTGGTSGIVALKDTLLIMEHCVLGNCLLAIKIESFASALLNDCDISQVGMGILLLSGANSKIIDCRISDGNDGILFYPNEFYQGEKNAASYQDYREEKEEEFVEGTNAILENCEIFNINGNGLSIVGNTTPIVKNCKIHHCASTGITVFDGPSILGRNAVFENCMIEENEGINVRIMNASPIFRDCTIVNAKGKKDAIPEKERDGLIVSGSCIWVIHGGEPKFINCQISSKYGYELDLESLVGVGYGVNATFESCTFTGSEINSFLLTFHQKGESLVKQCTIKEADVEAAIVFGGANVRFEDSVFESNEIGLFCRGDGMISVKNCFFNDNRCGINVQEKGEANVYHSRFTHSGVAVLMEDQAKGTFENNEISDSKMFGVVVSSEEPIVFRSNKLKNNIVHWLIQCRGDQLQRIDNEPNE